MFRLFCHNWVCSIKWSSCDAFVDAFVCCWLCVLLASFLVRLNALDVFAGYRMSKTNLNHIINMRTNTEQIRKCLAGLISADCFSFNIFFLFTLAAIEGEKEATSAQHILTHTHTRTKVECSNCVSHTHTWNVITSSAFCKSFFYSAP